MEHVAVWAGEDTAAIAKKYCLDAFVKAVRADAYRLLDTALTGLIAMLIEAALARMGALAVRPVPGKVTALAGIRHKCGICAPAPDGISVWAIRIKRPHYAASIALKCSTISLW